MRGKVSVGFPQPEQPNEFHKRTAYCRDGSGNPFDRFAICRVYPRTLAVFTRLWRIIPFQRYPPSHQCRYTKGHGICFGIRIRMACFCYVYKCCQLPCSDRSFHHLRFFWALSDTKEEDSTVTTNYCPITITPLPNELLQNSCDGRVGWCWDGL